ncbi:MAG: hypothetical protein ACK5XV_10480 [Flavobacteriales bacterium]|jgi:hypothetical protein
MKLIHIALFAVILFAGSEVCAQQTITAEQAQVTINSTTSRQQLADLRASLDQVGIKFLYEPEFDNNRNILGIRYQLVDAASGTILGSHEIHNLQNPAVKTSFRLAKTSGSWSAACVGTCED